MMYPERESKHLEFKSQLPKLSKLVKTCVAFANDFGGKIIIGVDDDGTILGIDENTRDRVYEQFPNSLYDATSPGLLAEIYEKRFDDKVVIIIEIPHSIKKPVCVKDEGIPKGVYLRAGPNTRRASQAYIEQLIRENKRMSYDEESIQTSSDILSDELLKEVLGRHTDKRRLLAEKILTQSVANQRYYYPTVAGTLCFCPNPEQYIPEAMVMCTRLKGKSGRDILNTVTITGHLEQQAEQTFNLIKQWLIQSYELVGIKLKSRLIVPEEAVREAIINALLHRKYWIPGAVKVTMFDNRLELFNPGSFPGLVDVDNLGDGTTYLRNPHLAKLARRLGLIEKLGTGVRLMKDSCSEAGIKQPEFIEGSDSVKVIFYFLPDKANNQSEMTSIMDLFNLKTQVSVKEVSEFLGVSRNTATRKLNQLMDDNQIKRVGKGPSTRYIKLK